MIDVERPKAVTVCAIFNFIFAGLGFTCLGLAMVGKLIGGAKSRTPIEETWVGTWQMISIPLGLVATVLILVAGFGLLQRKPWGRTLSLAWSAWNIFGLVVQVFVLFAYALPNPELFLPDNAPAVSTTIVRVSSVIGLLIAAPYPIILLAVMNRPHVIKWFEGPAAVTE